MPCSATVDGLFALSSVVKLFSGQGPPPTGNQDLTVVLASCACSRETTPGHEQVCVPHRIRTLEVMLGCGSKLNVKMTCNVLCDFFSAKRQASLLPCFALVEVLFINK